MEIKTFLQGCICLSMLKGTTGTTRSGGPGPPSRTQAEIRRDQILMAGAVPTSSSETARRERLRLLTFEERLQIALEESGRELQQVPREESDPERMGRGLAMSRQALQHEELLNADDYPAVDFYFRSRSRNNQNVLQRVYGEGNCLPHAICASLTNGNFQDPRPEGAGFAFQRCAALQRKNIMDFREQHPNYGGDRVTGSERTDKPLHIDHVISWSALWGINVIVYEPQFARPGKDAPLSGMKKHFIVGQRNERRTIALVFVNNLLRPGQIHWDRVTEPVVADLQRMRRYAARFVPRDPKFEQHWVNDKGRVREKRETVNTSEDYARIAETWFA